jgi:hypothetical protein
MTSVSQKQNFTIESLLKNREYVLLVSMTLLYLLPIWAFTYFPSQDGPAHLYNATLIQEFISPSHDIFQKYYQLNTNLVPTWFPHLILVALMYIFDPLTSEKIFLTFYVIIFISSVRYALGAINLNSRWLVFLAFPLIYSDILNMGFYANSVSYAMSFFVMGYWLRYSDKWALKNLVIFGLLVFLLYLFHIVSFAMTMGVIGVFIICSIYDDMKSRNEARRFTEIVKFRITAPLLSILPTLLFAAIFMGSKMTTFEFSGDPWLRFKSLLHFEFIASFQLLCESNYSYFYALLVAALFIAAVAVKVKQRHVERNDMLFMASIACTLVYLGAPEVFLVSPNGMEGGGYIGRRIMAFPYFLMILWFASQEFSAVLKRSIVALSVLFSVVILFVNLYQTALINEQVEEFLSGADYIEPHTTILPLVMSRYGYSEDDENLQMTSRIDPVSGAINHLARQRSLLMMANYEARVGYFPVMYRDELNPYTYIDGKVMSAQNERINFSDYEKRTGGKGKIDYILVWLGRKVITNEEFSQSIYRQVEDKYELLYVSKNGLMELYRSKE